MSLPRTLRYRGVPRDDASIVPYIGCGNAGFAVGRRVAPVRRGGIHPARRRSRRRGVRRDEGIPPYDRPEARVPSGLTVRSPGFVGEGHDPPADPAVSRGSRDDASIVPYIGCGNAGFAVGRRVARAHNVRPYMGCGNAGFAVDRGVARAHNVRPYMGCGGAGFAVGRGVARAHNVRPYMGCGNAGFAVGCGVCPVRRGGFHIRPGRRRAAGSGACRGLQPPSAAVMPQFSIKALRFPG